MFGRLGYFENPGESEISGDVWIGDVFAVDVEEGGVRVRQVLGGDDVDAQLAVEEERLRLVDLVICSGQKNDIRKMEIWVSLL